MFVHYYDVRCCTCANVDNRPVLIAPPDTGYDLLTMHEFVLLADGRWCHFLTQQEYEHVMTGYPNHDVSFGSQVYQAPLPTIEDPEKVKAGNRCALIAFILFGTSILLPGIAALLMGGFNVLTETAKDSESGNPIITGISSILGGISSLTEIAAFVMMIVTRVKYPKNVWGKVLMWIYIVLGILIVIGMVLLILACAYCVNEMRRCPG